MALIKCPECSREISDKAEACPHCGYPVSAYLEEKKAEQLKAEELEAERLKIEEQDLLLNNVREEYLKIETIADTEAETGAPRNWKAILSIVLFLSILCTYAIHSANNKIEKENEEAKQTKLEHSKKLYAQAKAIVNKMPNVTDEEILLAKTALTNDGLKDSPEYQEAQKLLPQISKHVDEINKKRENLAIEKAKEERKKERTREEAGLSAKGKRLRAKYPYWSIEEIDTISKGRISIGMTKEQVAAAWGRPYHINKTTGSYGVHEQWVMHEMGSSYVYFQDGICTTIQN